MNKSTVRNRLSTAWSHRALLHDMSHRMDDVGVRLYAAAIAYRTIFSVIAFMSTFVLVAMLLGLDAGELRILDSTNEIPQLSDDIETVARERVARTLELGSSSVIVAGLIGFSLGIYGMSGGFAAICDVLDRIHGTNRYVRLTVRYIRGAEVRWSSWASWGQRWCCSSYRRQSVSSYSPSSALRKSPGCGRSCSTR